MCLPGAGHRWHCAFDPELDVVEHLCGMVIKDASGAQKCPPVWADTLQAALNWMSSCSPGYVVTRAAYLR
jgi:hypothetical protein